MTKLRFEITVKLTFFLPILSTALVEYRESLVAAAPSRPVLHFDDDRRIIRWDGGHVKFRSNGVRRYFFVKELYLSETGYLSAAELGERLHDDDLKSWDAIRMIGTRTENDNLEPVSFPYMLEVYRSLYKIPVDLNREIC